MRAKEEYGLNLNGYDPFIDYLKGISIIFVVLTHALPFQDYILFPFWGGQAVPLFLLVQSFHFFKKSETPRLNVGKTFKRVLWPFLLQNLLVIGILIAFSHNSIKEILIHTIECGGNGPGSYYVWVYLQFVFILPLLGLVYKRYGIKTFTVVVLLICVLFEVVCSLIQPSPFVYRLLCFRYFSLPLLALAWVRKGIRIDGVGVILSLVGIAFIIIFYYFKLNLEPVFFDTEWRDHHWICFFYTAIMFTFIMMRIYKNTPPRICSLIKQTGVYSYEVYLWQMVVFKLFSEFYNHDFINHSFAIILKIILTVILSFLPVYYILVKDGLSRNEAENHGN